MKNKKIIIPIAVILLLVGGGTLWVKNSKNQKLDTRDNKREDETTFTNSGAVKEFKKLSVLSHKCVGCGRCMRADPEHFEMIDRKSKVINSDNLESPKLQLAIKNCPAKAIALE